MIHVRCLIFITIFSIVFNSCSKDDASGKDQLIIDAKLFFSEPSSIIVDLSQNDFLNQINPVSTVTLLNDAGESLNVRKVEANDKTSDRDLVVGCDLTTNLPGLEEVCENCKLALQGQGEARFIRPFYWPIN